MGNFGGCNGFTYDLLPMSEMKKKTKYDEICKIDDIPIQICGHSLLNVIGTKIDWNEDVMGKNLYLKIQMLKIIVVVELT